MYVSVSVSVGTCISLSIYLSLSLYIYIYMHMYMHINSYKFGILAWAGCHEAVRWNPLPTDTLRS